MHQTVRIFFFLAAIFTPVLAWSQDGGMKGTDMPMKGMNTKPPSKAALQPAEGASVKIVSPAKGQVFKGDQVPLAFKLVKGKHGAHVHAYVDGRLMGMFQTEKGTLTGIEPGSHTLELRVTTADHAAELNATDRVRFVVE
ncbi:MAG TPA: hypothetical protein VGA73_19170 [Candidatus Binatia bacterium]